MLFPVELDLFPGHGEETSICRMILETQNEGLLVIDKLGLITYVNQKMCNMLACSCDEIVGKNILHFITEDTCCQIAEDLYERKRGLIEKKRYEVSFCRHNGQIFPASLSTMPLISDKRSYFGSVMLAADISEQNHSDGLFQAVFYSSPYPMAIYSFDGLIYDVNARYCENLGYTREEVIGRHALELKVIQDEGALLSLRAKLESEGSVRNYEVVAVTRDGKKRRALFNADIVQIGGKHYALSSLYDITDWMAAEEESKQANKRFIQLFQENPCSMVIYDSKENLIDVNKACTEMTGYTREELIGTDTRTLGIHPQIEDVEKVRNLMSQNGKVENFQAKILSKSGEVKEVVLNCNSVVIDGEYHVAATMLDVTKSKRLEAEVSRLDRLNLVGQMAASIGHEIRNPLTTVRGYIQMMLHQKRYPEREEHFQVMIDEIDRANSIITEYLSLAKNRTSEFRYISLNVIIEAVRPLLEAAKNERGCNIEFILEDLPPLQLDEKEIRQVILNLVNNAIDAICQGGKVRIRTLAEERHVNLIVENDGEPIPSEIIEKLGTPFFSTKESGTGLGLAVCYSIAARHGANIGVTSDTMGTKFTVQFPIPAL